MFKKLVAPSIILLILSVFSQPAKALDVYGFGSRWEIEDLDGVWGGGAGLSVPLFTEYFRLDARAYFFENSDVNDDDELDIVPFDFGVQLHAFPGERIDLYAAWGASYVYVDAERLDIDSEFGAYAGLGMELEIVKGVRPFVEGRYRFLERDDDDTMTGQDIELDGFIFNVGLKFHYEFIKY